MKKSEFKKLIKEAIAEVVNDLAKATPTQITPEWDVHVNVDSKYAPSKTIVFIINRIAKSMWLEPSIREMNVALNNVKTNPSDYKEKLEDFEYILLNFESEIDAEKDEMEDGHVFSRGWENVLWIPNVKVDINLVTKNPFTNAPVGKLDKELVDLIDKEIQKIEEETPFPKHEI